MLRRALMLSSAFLLAVPVTAAAQQSISLSLGGFSPRGEETRDSNDVLLNNLDFLAFNISDLTGFSVGGEYLIALGDKFDAGVGINYYKHSTAAVDRFSEFQDTGDPIVADLSLHQVPITATFRFLPLGHRGFAPYVGGGVGIIHYSYSENGDFVSSDNVTIVHGDFTGDGWATGPVVLGGVRVPVGSVALGGELKYQAAIGNLPANQGFATAAPGLTPQIDLGGWTYSFTINFKF